MSTDQPAVPEPGEHNPWYLLGFLGGVILREGSITIKSWNEAVHAARIKK